MSIQLPNGLWSDFNPQEDARLKANANFHQLDWTQWKCIIAQIKLVDLPVSAAVGDSYLVDAAQVYIWYNAQWNILTPPCGWMFYDQTLNEFFWNVGGVTTNLQQFFTGIYHFIRGPITSTLNNVPVFDNLTGDLVRETSVNITPFNDVSGIQNLSVIKDVAVGNSLKVNGAVNFNGTFGHSVTKEFANQVWEKTERLAGATVGIRGVAISAESVLVTETGTTAQDIGVVAEVETTGRSVHIFLTSDSSNGRIRIDINDAAATHFPYIGYVSILRDGIVIYDGEFGFEYPTTGDLMVRSYPVSCVHAIDNSPAAGVHQYTCTIRLQTTSGTGTISVDDTKIVAYEL